MVCYYFKIRFPELEIYYLPIQGHFIVGKDNSYYDWTGKIKIEEPFLLNNIKQKDPLWYSHLIRGCFN